MSTSSPGRRAVALAAVLALAAALAACSTADGPADGRAAARIDTLPGGAILVANGERGAWDPASAWRLEEDLRIGAADGDGPDTFADVHDVAVDDAGRIYVLQRTVKTVHVFDSAGRFVRAIGRAGKGPGELEVPMGLRWDPQGRLWVADSRNARYTAFDLSGAVLASHRRPLTSYGWRWEGRFMPDGRLVELELFGTAERSNVVYLRLDGAFAVADTLLAQSPQPRSEEGVFVFRRGPSTAYLQIPFLPRDLVELDERGFHWTADPAAYRLVQRTLDGDTVRVISRAYQPVPVADGDLAGLRERYRTYIEGGQGWDESRIPAAKPAFSAMAIADDGHLWLRLHRPHGDSLAAFDLFDGEGRYLGVLRAPVALAEGAPFLVRGGALYGVSRDELDVPSVVRLRIVRPRDGRTAGQE